MTAVSQAVLVVEDDESLRLLMTVVLEGAGYRVVGVADGSSAIEAAQHHVGSIDMLLTDLQLPDMSGTEVARTLKERHSAMHVVFVSGYGAPTASQAKALSPGFHWIQKPFMVQDLLRRVREILASAPS